MGCKRHLELIWSRAWQRGSAPWEGWAFQEGVGAFTWKKRVPRGRKPFALLNTSLGHSPGLHRERWDLVPLHGVS